MATLRGRLLNIAARDEGVMTRLMAINSVVARYRPPAGGAVGFIIGDAVADSQKLQKAMTISAEVADAVAEPGEDRREVAEWILENCPEVMAELHRQTDRMHRRVWILTGAVSLSAAGAFFVAMRVWGLSWQTGVAPIIAATLAMAVATKFFLIDPSKDWQ